MPTVPQYAPDFKIVVRGQTLQLGRSIDVLSVSVTDVADGADSFNITVQDRRPELVRLFAGGEKLTWMDSGVFDEGNEVQIHMGYVNDLAFMLRGRIKACSVSFPESGQPTLQVEGYSLYHDLQSRRRREPYAGKTVRDIATDIAQAMGLSAETDPTAVQRPLVSPNGATYAEILESLARRLDFEVVTKDKTLYFQKPRYKKSLSPAVTFEWGRNLRSFSARLSMHGIESEVASRASQTAEGRGKQAVVGRTSAGAERGRMGRQSASQVADRIYGQYREEEDSPLLVDFHDMQNQQEANEVALAEMERRSLGFITGRASVAGDTRVRAGYVVELVGLGARFSGVYYITSATHTIDGNGYGTEFEVRRNAL